MLGQGRVPSCHSLRCASCACSQCRTTSWIISQLPSEDGRAVDVARYYIRSVVLEQCNDHFVRVKFIMVLAGTKLANIGVHATCNELRNAALTSEGSLLAIIVR